MTWLRKFENRLEEIISGTFARTFKSAVQPIEISAALNREIDNSAQILSRDRRLVPNNFSVELSETDATRIAEHGEQLNRELEDMLRDHAAHQGYVFTGPISIKFDTAADLITGRFRVTSQAIGTVQSNPKTNTQTPTNAYLDINGTLHPIPLPGISIGRTNDADLRVDDPSVSRRHARILVAEGASGTRVKIQDLGSTNGIQVNGKKTDAAQLVDGAEIKLGNTIMVLRLQPKQ